MNIRISIAMTSYNGAKYLQQQIDSFLTQTRQPDELVICDDGSTDSTFEILEKFRQIAPFAVLVFRNEANLGHAKNFEKAISLCTGDIIFLSDQDDVWFETKVENMVNCFDRIGNTQIAIHDCDICDVEGRLSGGRLFENRTTKRGKESIHIHGCCTVVTREMVNICLPLPPLECGRYGHDDWLHLAGQYLNVRKVVDKSYQYYRRHELNATQSNIYIISDSTFLDRYKYYRKKLNEFTSDSKKHVKILRERLSSVMLLIERVNADRYHIENTRHNFYLTNLKVRERDLSARIKISTYRKTRRVYKACIMYLQGYYKTSSGWKSFIVDIMKKN